MQHCVEISAYSLWLKICLFNDIYARWRNLPVTLRENNRTGYLRRRKNKATKTIKLNVNWWTRLRKYFTRESALKYCKVFEGWSSVMWPAWTCQIQFQVEYTASLNHSSETLSLLTTPQSLTACGIPPSWIYIMACLCFSRNNCLAAEHIKDIQTCSLCNKLQFELAEVRFQSFLCLCVCRCWKEVGLLTSSFWHWLNP